MCVYWLQEKVFLSFVNHGRGAWCVCVCVCVCVFWGRGVLSKLPKKEQILRRSQCQGQAHCNLVAEGAQVTRLTGPNC